MPVRRLKEYLDSNYVKYVSIVHSEAYTAQEVAESAHVSGKKLAKTVIVKKDGQMAMVVLPASQKINWDLLKAAIGTSKIELANEQEFKNIFPDCEIGAMPPFGNLYDMEVFVDSSLINNKDIAFNAGSHIEVIRLSYEVFSKLVHPKIVDLLSHTS